MSSAPSTRSSIMAIWQSVRGAKGYLLDVSTTSLFSSYVEGYHDVDVGNVIRASRDRTESGYHLLLPSAPLYCDWAG